MAIAYSEDLRKKAMNLVDAGSKVADVAKMLDISEVSLYRWKKQRDIQGSLAPKKDWRKGYGHKISDLEKFRKFAEENQGLTAVEMATKWGNITPKTIRKFLHRIGFSQKKRLMVTKNGVKKNVEYIWKK